MVCIVASYTLSLREYEVLTNPTKRVINYKVARVTDQIYIHHIATLYTFTDLQYTILACYLYA